MKPVIPDYAWIIFGVRVTVVKAKQAVKTSKELRLLFCYLGWGLKKGSGASLR